MEAYTRRKSIFSDRTIKIVSAYRQKEMEDKIMSNYIEPNIIEVKPLDDFCLYLKFEDGKEKVYDMKPLIEKVKSYEKLRNKEYFKLVKPCYDSVEWPNGEDVCPENLYYKSVDYEKNTKKA